MNVLKSSQTCATVIPEEKIDISNSQDLKQVLLDLYEEGFLEIVLDFAKVNRIDSSGLGKLLLMQKKLMERQGELKIINLSSDYIREMFAMLQIDKVINYK